MRSKMQERESELELRVKLARALDGRETQEREHEDTHNACVHALEAHQSGEDKLNSEES